MIQGLVYEFESVNDFKLTMNIVLTYSKNSRIYGAAVATEKKLSQSSN